MRNPPYLKAEFAHLNPKKNLIQFQRKLMIVKIKNLIQIQYNSKFNTIPTETYVSKNKKFSKNFAPGTPKNRKFRVHDMKCIFKNFPASGGSAPRTPWFIACAFMYLWILFCVFAFKKMLSSG